MGTTESSAVQKKLMDVSNTLTKMFRITLRDRVTSRIEQWKAQTQGNLTLRVFEPGCGNGEAGKPLVDALRGVLGAETPVVYEGMDVNATNLALAQYRPQYQAEGVRFTQADATVQKPFNGEPYHIGVVRNPQLTAIDADNQIVSQPGVINMIKRTRDGIVNTGILVITAETPAEIKIIQDLLDQMQQEGKVKGIQVKNNDYPTPSMYHDYTIFTADVIN